ncbi:hypothetical protein HC891_21380, partial [Candidatus Gracilibacteria bacterium]|nr:hypothetical protein [Candidatus Gracilibacteria bacterium]
VVAAHGPCFITTPPQVIDGKFYLFGGLTRGMGKVQIYDPALNRWTHGANMPYAGGSVASALIGGKVYVAGGIVGSTTVNSAAVYDPLADSWAMLPPMPVGVNHAAAATDGQKFYIFGGRDGGNTVSNGFDYVQIYDPAANSWQSSSQSGSTLEPLPQARRRHGQSRLRGWRVLYHRRRDRNRRGRDGDECLRPGRYL